MRRKIELDPAQFERLTILMDRVMNWRWSRENMVATPITDPNFRDKFNALAEAEDALAKWRLTGELR